MTQQQAQVFHIFCRPARMHTFGACGLIPQPKCFARPVRTLGSDRAWREPASAGGTDIVKNGLNAVGAIGTFIGTDARILGIRRQILVAPFAIRSKFKHDSLGKKDRIPDQNLYCT